MGKSKRNSVDAITFEVVNSTFVFITRMMGHTLQRVSFSPIMYDSIDFSNALFSPKGELIGQWTNVPVHLAAMHFSVQESIKRYGLDDIHDGDIIVLNDPYKGGTHIPDITFTMPIFYKGKLAGFAASRGHWADLGGGAPSGRVPTGVHICQEGLRIPPTKIYKKGDIVPEIRDIIVNNTRTPKEILGNLQAHKAALFLAQEYMKSTIAKYGFETVMRCMDMALDYTERQVRDAIRQIPNGRYEGAYYVDSNNVSKDSIWVKVALDVKDDTIDVDFTGTDRMTVGNINYPYGGTMGCVYWGFKFFLAPNVNQNGGMYRPFNIHLPKGIFINAEWPACTYSGNLSTAEAVVDAIWMALSKAIPKQVPGLPYGDSNGVTIGGVAYGKEQSSFVAIDLPPGGWGGTPVSDGMSATYSRHGNCMDLQIELAEALYPLRFLMRELIPDSGGAGKFRGGLAMREGFHFLQDVEVGHGTSRSKEGPKGMNGGKNGKPGSSVKNYGTPCQETIAGWDSKEWKICSYGARFKTGENLVLNLQGGGGWGDPAKRGPELIERDIEDGYVTREGAARDYGYKGALHDKK
ncbi:MAG: hydantoinase B/oxoprolinase family protein [Syntrophales bacterium]|jgi:N-methylhydantoinase B|nr:hydantoinase B/oxoprolinase family protein [Syntrophales bacterium]